MTYDSETWALRKIDKNVLIEFRERFLGKCMNHVRTNLQLNGEYVKTMNLMNCIKEDIIKIMLRWTDHYWRKNGSLVKTVQENVRVPQGKRLLKRQTTLGR